MHKLGRGTVRRTTDLANTGVHHRKNGHIMEGSIVRIHSIDMIATRHTHKRKLSFYVDSEEGPVVSVCLCFFFVLYFIS